MDALGNIYACLASGKKTEDQAQRQSTEPHPAPLIICAHLDTVFPETTNLAVRHESDKVFGPGIGDNSLGVAALFGLIWQLRERQEFFKADTWLVADVCEEGLGDLQGMRAVADRFGNEVRGYLIVEGLALGHVYHRAVGVRRYRIRALTAGGHSWSDFGKPSAVHELAALITRITAMQVPREPRTTLNVGTMRGGSGVNVLAAEAECEVDLRSESGSILESLAGRMETLVKNANREGIKVETDMIGQRPAGVLKPDHPFVKLGKECLMEQGVEATLTSGSTDANIPLSRNLPAIVLGVTTGGGAHTINEFIDVGPIESGLGQLVRFVERAWD
jgi:acetylornithine deacetylase/succinyl-diaminopimelate desuccinylase-like protein